MSKDEFEYIVLTKNSNEKYFNDILENAAFIHNRAKDSLDWLKWKYFGSPHGNCIVVLAYSQEGKLAGEISFGRYRFVDSGKIIKAIYSYQTMVHPAFQRKGLFSTLTKKVIEIARQENIDIIFNFPNHNSYQPFLKLNFIPLDSLKYWVARGDFKTFIKEFSPLSIKKPFLVNKTQSYNIDTINNFERLAKNIETYKINNVLYPYRSYDFLKWRYFTFAMHQYEIVHNSLGWAIIRLGKRGSFSEAQIMEIFPYEQMNTLFLKSIVHEIRTKLKTGLIVFNMSDAHPLNKEMPKSGFISLPTKIKFCIFPLNEIGENYLTKDKWVITATEFHRY